MTIVLVGLLAGERRSQILSCPEELVERTSICMVHVRDVTVALSAFSGIRREEGERERERHDHYICMHVT